METRDKLLQINNPPEIISYYTMRRAIGYLGSFAVLGVAFLPCSVSTAGQGCLLASSIENPLVGKLHNQSSLFYFMMLIVYALFLFPAMNQLNPEFWLETVVLFSFGISWLTKGQLLFRDENYQKGP